MQDRMPSGWEKIIGKSQEQIYFKELMGFIKREYNQNACYPEPNKIFSAFECCSFSQLKVVLLGQDPYHGKGQAHGLSFSVPEGEKHPPSLVNIFNEIEADLKLAYPESGNLERWAKQGVLLLNATLTVREGEAASHQKQGWEIFTDEVIRQISTECESIVFLLWGSFAKNKIKLIDGSKHLILSTGHPSPLSANRGYWFGNKHFSKCNEYLKIKGKKIIDW
tara:strand:+ start:3793 stop:4458 length:666 start_codon:yes stop_codon:yes gene_type:complete